jgi:small-conductance mechanosensitive channel
MLHPAWSGITWRIAGFAVGSLAGGASGHVMQRAIKESFDAEGFTIPFPRHEVRTVSKPSAE